MKQKKKMSFIYLETFNIEWGQIDPKGNRRVKNTPWNSAEVAHSTAIPIARRTWKKTSSKRHLIIKLNEVNKSFCAPLF